MAVKIRLKRLGQKKAPFYRIVVADERSPRDGKMRKQLRNGWLMVLSLQMLLLVCSNRQELKSKMHSAKTM